MTASHTVRPCDRGRSLRRRRRCHYHSSEGKCQFAEEHGQQQSQSRTTSPGRTRPPPLKLGEGWRARSLTTSAAPRRVSLRRLTGDQSMRMSPPRSPLSLSLARPFLRPPFRGESLRATENHHRRAGTDRPTERGSDRPSSVACGAAAVIAASEPREGEERDEGEGPATGVVMFLGQQHRGARCLVRLLFVSVRPSVRWTI